MCVCLSNVKDIHSVLEVTVFDEDRDRSADFLGKVVIPLLRVSLRQVNIYLHLNAVMFSLWLLHQVRNGEQKGYLLKNKELTGATKGIIYLEIDVIYNPVSVVCAALIRRKVRGHMICVCVQVKAALRTVAPAEHKYMEEEAKVSKQVC